MGVPGRKSLDVMKGREHSMMVIRIELWHSTITVRAEDFLLYYLARRF